jgi:hypothetical protein
MRNVLCFLTPVCSGEPLSTFTPGYIDKNVIYSNGTKPGWNW